MNLVNTTPSTWKNTPSESKPRVWTVAVLSDEVPALGAQWSAGVCASRAIAMRLARRWLTMEYGDQVRIEDGRRQQGGGKETQGRERLTIHGACGMPEDEVWVIYSEPLLLR